jgi:hypothetical protein
MKVSLICRERDIHTYRRIDGDVRPRLKQRRAERREGQQREREPRRGAGHGIVWWGAECAEREDVAVDVDAEEREENGGQVSLDAGGHCQAALGLGALGAGAEREERE